MLRYGIQALSRGRGLEKVNFILRYGIQVLRRGRDLERVSLCSGRTYRPSIGHGP
jgi:hypothetical protein